MAFLRNRSLLIILLAFFSLAMAPPLRLATIKGKVTVSGTTQGIAGSQIILSYPSGEVLTSALTDTKGNYQIKNILLSYYGNWYKLTATKPGYHTQSLTCFLRRGSLYVFNFRLSPDQTSPPQITSITPTDGSTFDENTAIVISPSVNDSDSSPLEYQFSVDGVIKQAWSSLSSYAWTARAGIHSLKIEVRDSTGNDSKEAEVCIFRRPLAPLH